MHQFTVIMAMEPEKLVKLCNLLLYSGIVAVSLYFGTDIGNDPCGFWQSLVCKSFEDSAKEFAEGISLVMIE